MAVEKRLNVRKHGVICHGPADMPGSYYGWPTVARMEDGSLVAGASGFRNAHICPYGKCVIFRSTDEGAAWSKPQIICNSLIDDRDVGLTPLPGNELLLSWFTSDTTWHINAADHTPDMQEWTEEDILKNLGSFTKLCRADGSWTKRRIAPVSAPHGPIVLRNGDLLYLGTRCSSPADNRTLQETRERTDHPQTALVSRDRGESWEERGGIPLMEGLHQCEPHVIELEDGTLIGHIRARMLDRTRPDFSALQLYQSVSRDGGVTWSTPEYLCEGGPAHLLRHSSGVLISSYGYRLPGFGQRVMLSYDQGQTWDTDLVIRDDGNTRDLGYPSTVELKDGSLLTVYYQALPGESTCAILFSEWELPEK